MSDVIQSDRDAAITVDVKAERKVFEIWWRAWCPGQDVPPVTSHVFDAWLASSRIASSADLRSKLDVARGALEDAQQELRNRAEALEKRDAKITEARRVINVIAAQEEQPTLKEVVDELKIARRAIACVAINSDPAKVTMVPVQLVVELLDAVIEAGTG